ncbi:MAG: nitrogen regulation protein NR(II) [Bdellovibrionales bacterium]
MRSFEVIHGGAALPGTTSSGEQRLLLVHGLRSGLLVAVFLLAQIFQLLQHGFLSPAIWLPVYAVLALLFLLNSAYFLFAEWFERRAWVHGALFGLDAVAITLLVHYTGASQSIFFFLYMVDIILAGLVFQKRGAFTQALWTSLLFGMLLLLAPQAGRENIYFLATLNNLAFFSVAYLSGNLSEQINFMGTELKRTTRSLEILKDLNKLIVENIGTGLVTVDGDGKILTSNSAAQSILDGLNLVGRDINTLFPALRLGVNVVALKSKGQEIRHEDVTFINRSREKLQIEVVISPLKDERAKPQGYVLMFQDRTEVRRLESAMRQKEKLAAVGQLAAGIAHEIRNPLASLSGSVQLMIAQPEKYGADDLKLMKIITREIDRLNDLITEFLDYVRPEAQPDQLIDVNRVLREALEVAKPNPQMSERLDQRAELKAKSSIQGHPDKLKQAFLNIIINAYQSMEKSEQPALKIESFDVKDQVVVVVKDQGNGMDEVTLARLFEPFYTTKPKGTGLGLAVTHKILENHKAQVQVASQLGQGTTFTITFPGVRDTYDPNVPTAREA